MTKYRIHNKSRDFGSYDESKDLILINKKRNKKAGKGELLDSIVHESLHAKHKKMSERDVRRKTAKMIANMSPNEKAKYYAKLKTKALNYKTGALKRKYKMDASVETPPGTFITKANDDRANFRAGIYGLI